MKLTNERNFGENVRILWMPVENANFYDVVSRVYVSFLLWDTYRLYVAVV